ncbi:MAG: YdcF family protein [Stellaceae bacterium]
MLQWISYSTLVPPNLFVLLTLIGVALAWRWRRAGLVLATVSVLCLYLTATPVVSFLLIRSADKLAGVVPSLPLPAPPGAIIVLSAEYRHSDEPGGRDVVGPVTLDRLAAAARQQRRTGLPILVSGGWLKGADDSLAGMMAESLGSDFGVPVRWREERSRTTYENALYSAEILRRAGISSALVVTNPWHMARALWSFYAVGYPVAAAPLSEGRALPLSPAIVFPDIPALLGSYYALHELIGLAWYVVRYGKG